MANDHYDNTAGFYSKLGKGKTSGKDFLKHVADPGGYIINDDDERRAEIDKLYAQILEGTQGLELPDLKDINLDTVDYAGDLTYEDIQAILQGDSEMKGIETDPRLKEHQMSALASLSELADNGGMTIQDKANLARIQSDVAQADRGRREAIMQNAQQQGMGGSGMEMLAKLQSSQAATDRNAQQGLDVAGMAQQRALQAMMNRGQMSGQMQAQDFSQQAQIAAAQDAINKFNTANQNQFGIHNSTMGFNADARNLDTKQGLNNTNTGIANQQTMHNEYTIPQQNFNNASAKQGLVNDAIEGQAGHQEKGLAADQRQREGILGIFGSALSFSDERLKKDVSEVKEVDIEEFLDSFSPKNFKFKDPKHGEGRHTGFMAQDVKDTKLGQDLVTEDQDGNLTYDQQKLAGIQMAAIKFLADKIKEK